MKCLFFLIMSVMLSGLHAGTTDAAYAAYKKGHAAEAFRLYRRAWKKEGSTKAAYNLAVFYEKGIGTSRNPAKAQKYYRIVHDRIYRIFPIRKICDDPMLPYYRKTLRKLTEYRKKDHYRKLLREIDESCTEQEQWRAKANDRYLKVCPAASVIPAWDRIDLDRYDCVLFRKYPGLMKEYLHLYRQRKQFLLLAERGDDLEAKRKAVATHRRIKKIVAPIMRNALKKEERCIRKAHTVGELSRCNLNYVFFADHVMGCEVTMEGCNFSPDPEKACEEERRFFAQPLKEADRKKAIDSIREELRKGDYFTGDCRTQYL